MAPASGDVASSQQDGGMLLSNPTFRPMSSSGSMAFPTVQNVNYNKDLNNATTLKRSDTQSIQYNFELDQQKADHMQPTMSIAFDKPPLSLRDSRHITTAAADEHQHAVTAVQPPTTAAAVQYDEFSLSKIFYGESPPAFLVPTEQLRPETQPEPTTMLWLWSSCAHKHTHLTPNPTHNDLQH
jgi:hypothetical protein